MTKSMITHMPDDQVRRFDRLAERSGISRAELLRRLVTAHLNQHQTLPHPVPSWPDRDADAPAFDADERRSVLTARYEERAARR